VTSFHHQPEAQHPIFSYQQERRPITPSFDAVDGSSTRHTKPAGNPRARLTARYNELAAEWNRLRNDPSWGGGDWLVDKRTQSTLQYWNPRGYALGFFQQVAPLAFMAARASTTENHSARPSSFEEPLGASFV